MAKNNHYSPEFHLRRFIDGAEGLWQLDKSNGQSERRNPSKAGMIRGLYPDALEDGYLQEIDCRASTILQSSVYDRDTICLTEEQRQTLSEWFGTLVHRNPKKLVEAKDFVARAHADPRSVIDPEVNYGEEYATLFKAEHPDVWREEVEHIKTEETLQAAIAEVGAEEVLRQVVIRMTDKKVSEGDIFSDGDGQNDDPKGIFSRLINKTRSADWASWVMKYHWSWWRTDQEFITSDDPICCYSPKLKHVEYGLAYEDCEITIALSRKLCLLMRRVPCDEHTVKLCDRITTAKWNNRHWLSASRLLYGSFNQIAHEAERWRDMAAGRIGKPKGG